MKFLGEMFQLLFVMAILLALGYGAMQMMMALLNAAMGM